MLSRLGSIRACPAPVRPSGRRAARRRGLVRIYQSAIDAFPDVSSTQVKIIVKAPGMTPEEMEARIVTPIEIEMLGIPKQRMLRSLQQIRI
jgi:cobalt-zinc-cadmium resistance protein CzcA